MPVHSASLLAAEAARRLGVSIKALRHYEEKGLLQPARTTAGYRHYGPKDLLLARDIVTLRTLGLSLEQIHRTLRGDVDATDLALALREKELAEQFSAMKRTSHRIRELRAGLVQGQALAPGRLSEVLGTSQMAVSFALPWPWGGERFGLEVARLTYLVGPLGSGKTRLALCLAREMPNGKYLGLDRLEDPIVYERSLHLNPHETAKMEIQLAALRNDGAVDLAALRVLIASLEAHGGRQPLVIDMIEAGLTRASQEALLPVLRRHVRSREAPVVVMTRSSSILDLENLGPDEEVLYCPANHAVPFLVPPFAGAIGYETLSSCLATPEVRERVACTPTP